jgi:sugar lactone lactonase YvrE
MTFFATRFVSIFRKFNEAASARRCLLTLMIALLCASLMALRQTSAQSGIYVTTFAGSSFPGNDDGPGAQARFSAPIGLTIDANDNLIVADFHNGRIRRIDPQGNVTTIAGSAQGFANGTAASARFYGPAGVALDRDGNIIVADYGNNRIRRIDPQGNVTTLAGSGVYGALDGSALNARFGKPSGVAVDATGNIYVLDAGTSLIRKIDVNRNVTTLAGGIRGFADGQGSEARFDFYGGAPQLCFAADGTLIVADFSNHRIRRVTPDGRVTTIAGNNNTFTNDGPLAEAGFFFPTGVVCDAKGNLIVGGWHDAKVRKIDLIAQMVTTIAGSGDEGHQDGPAAQAMFIRPAGVAVSSRGDVFVADYADNCIRRISGLGVAPSPTPTPGGTPTPTPTPPPVPVAGALVNPSFETGDWSGWTISSVPIEGGPTIETDPSLVTDGQYALKFSARGRRLYDYCKQAVRLAPGSYTLTCEAKASIGTTSVLGILFSDGTAGPGSRLGPGISGRLSVDFTVPENAGPVTIFFLGSQNRYVRSWVAVDNFVLTKN